MYVYASMYNKAFCSYKHTYNLCRLKYLTYKIKPSFNRLLFSFISLSSILNIPSTLLRKIINNSNSIKTNSNKLLKFPLRIIYFILSLFFNVSFYN